MGGQQTKAILLYTYTLASQFYIIFCNQHLGLHKTVGKLVAMDINVSIVSLTILTAYTNAFPT